MKKSFNKDIAVERRKPRNGCIDIWNAYMVRGAEFDSYSDIPICTCTNADIPSHLVSYEDAKAIYRKKIKSGLCDFFENAYIHFYVDDYKFDGKKNSIWLYPDRAIDVIKHFSGVITPDFSTNADFPDPIKRYNTYRMRAFGCWMVQLGIPVINNVRWGTLETWSYCFDGIPKNSIVAIGTVASDLKLLSVRPIFMDGLYKMTETLKPRTIIVYGSDKYSFFDKLRDEGIKIVAFPSKMNEIFSRKVGDE